MSEICVACKHGEHRNILTDCGSKHEIGCKYKQSRLIDGTCIMWVEKKSNQEIKSDAGKPRISLVPPQIIRDIAEVRQYGVQKYGDKESWREVELERYIDALLRHTLAFMADPQGVDAESGIKHYKHMECNLAFISELMEGENETNLI